MLAFLLQAASSTSLPKGNAMEKEGKTVHETAVYFDILVIDIFVTAKNLNAFPSLVPTLHHSVFGSITGWLSWVLYHPKMTFWIWISNSCSIPGDIHGLIPSRFCKHAS